MRSLNMRLSLAFLLALPLLTGAVRAEVQDVAPRREHVDSRHNHNHSYPDRGVIVGEMSRGATVVRFGQDRYWYHGGVWYRPDGPRFVVIAPPAGAVVELLPPVYTTVMAGGQTYYYANDTYYLYSGRARGFEVIEAPPGIEGGSGAAFALAAPAGGGENVFAYPTNGQSPEQQSTDRYECHRWAVEQAGFDPTRAGGDGASEQLAQKRSDYGRATNACLEARGYTVR